MDIMNIIMMLIINRDGADRFRNIPIASLKARSEMKRREMIKLASLAVLLPSIGISEGKLGE
jgi:hypothetical protein